MVWKLYQACACQHTMRFGSIAKVLAECKLKYYRISECSRHDVRGLNTEDGDQVEILWMREAR